MWKFQTLFGFPRLKYLGVTPSESSSGENISRSSITKQVNATVRSMLVECANTLAKGTIGLKARQKGQSSDVIKNRIRANKKRTYPYA
nr:IS110 family transposase [Bacillus cereus]